VTARLELVRALQRNETSMMRTLFPADAGIARRFGIEAAVVVGALCMSDRAFPIPLLHRAVGFGTLCDVSQRTLDRIIRFFALRGLPARVEIAEGVVPARAAPLLERAGFRRESERHQVHVLETAVAPHVPAIQGLRVRRAAPATFGKAVRQGFDVGGDLGLLFERASAAHVRTERERAVPLVPFVDGKPAGSALLWLSPRIAGLYSGSVFEGYRGRGLQLALIAERVRLGLARRRRIFTSQTEGDGPSAHNLRDMGFRPLYETAYFIRDTQ
jgi:hypothetical protein